MKNTQSNEALENQIILDILEVIAGTARISGSDLDRANALFRIIRAVCATSLAQLATDTKNLADINNELHAGILQIATLIFNEQNKS